MVHVCYNPAPRWVSKSSPRHRLGLSARTWPMKKRSLLMITFVLFVGVTAKRRKKSTVGGTNVQGRKRECEAECSSTDEDDRPNCILRCQSEACYSQVYLPEELEPGEIDLSRQRAFQNCITKEAQDQAKAARKRVRGGAPAEKEQAEAVPTVADAAADEVPPAVEL